MLKQFGIEIKNRLYRVVVDDWYTSGAPPTTYLTFSVVALCDIVYDIDENNLLKNRYSEHEGKIDNDLFHCLFKHKPLVTVEQLSAELNINLNAIPGEE